MTKPFQFSLLDREEKPAGVPLDVLQELLEYSPETGEFTWKNRPSCYFTVGNCPPESQAKKWNARFAGRPALTAHDTGGYRHGKIFNHLYRAHRVAWALHTGEWPNTFIDHINGVRNDNRIANLRLASIVENARNCRVRFDNKSGITGVGFHKRLGRWFANIGVGGVLLHLGYFNNMEAAILARKAAETEHGFHENHGKRAA